MELIGLYLVAAGLLVVAGVAKALRPRRHGTRARGSRSPRPGRIPARFGPPAGAGRCGGRSRAGNRRAAAAPARSRRPSSPSPTRPSARLSPTPARRRWPARDLRVLRAARHTAHNRAPSTRRRPSRRRCRCRCHRACAGTLFYRARPSTVGRVPLAVRERGRALAESAGALVPRRTRRRAPAGPDAASRGGGRLVSLSTALVVRTAPRARGPSVAPEPDQPVCVCRERGRRGVRTRSRAAAGHRLRPDLRMRERRL